MILHIIDTFLSPLANQTKSIDVQLIHGYLNVIQVESAKVCLVSHLCLPSVCLSQMAFLDALV